ncbi:MAG: hypothetical protein SNJ80_06655 [Anaerolinea sp.]
MRVGVLSLLIAGLGLSALWAQAQDNAQICVRLYEDRGERGVLDAGDPFITRDVGVNLANADGIIIETALIDDAPQGSSGRVCFARLPAGQYTVSVASAAYEPTTDSVFVTSVGGSAVPVVFDVGMERLMVELPPPAPAIGTLTPAELRFAVERVFVASIGATVVVAVMLTLGVILYVLFLRPKPQPVPPPRSPYAPPRPPLRPDTGSIPPVTGTPPPMRPITGPIPPVTGTPPPMRPITGPVPPVPPPQEHDDNK